MLMNLCADAGLVAFYWASEATPSHTSLISVSIKNTWSGATCGGGKDVRARFCSIRKKC